MKSYVIKNDELFPQKIERLISQNFSNDLLTLFKNSEIILAGNAIRHYLEKKEINFFDFFCFSKADFNKCKEILIHNNFVLYKEEEELIVFNKNKIWVYIYLSDRSKNIIDILENFGFTIDKIGYYKEMIIMHKRFFEDDEKKHLIYCGSSNPKISFARMKMLKLEGYTITKTELELIERDLDRIEY